MACLEDREAHFLRQASYLDLPRQQHSWEKKRNSKLEIDSDSATMLLEGDSI